MNHGTFQIGGRDFAVPMTAVREVLHRARISPVPLAPEGLRGMTLCRGEVLPVFELAAHLEVVDPAPATDPVSRPRVLVLQHNGRLAGVAADATSTAASTGGGSARTADGREAVILDVAALFDAFTTWIAAVQPHVPPTPHAHAHA